jgi:hypothetical protein
LQGIVTGLGTGILASLEAGWGVVFASAAAADFQAGPPNSTKAISYFQPPSIVSKGAFFATDEFLKSTSPNP